MRVQRQSRFTSQAGPFYGKLGQWDISWPNRKLLLELSKCHKPPEAMLSIHRPLQSLRAPFKWFCCYWATTCWGLIIKNRGNFFIFIIGTRYWPWMDLAHTNTHTLIKWYCRSLGWIAPVLGLAGLRILLAGLGIVFRRQRQVNTIRGKCLSCKGSTRRMLIFKWFCMCSSHVMDLYSLRGSDPMMGDNCG